jgi:hypothetical protein
MGAFGRDLEVAALTVLGPDRDFSLFMVRDVG